MALRIITADERQAEARGIKAVIFGKSGIGKTYLLLTLDEGSTLFIDLEAGDLAVQHWRGASMGRTAAPAGYAAPAYAPPAQGYAPPVHTPPPAVPAMQQGAFPASAQQPTAGADPRPAWAR